MRLIPYAIFPLIALFFMGPASGQQTVSPSPVQTVSPTASDSTKLIHLVTADLFRKIKKESDSGELNILSGHVVMKQGNTTFYCDSAIQDPRRNSFEAFGNIHINDRDSIHTYSQYLKYTGDNRTAVLKKR